MMMNSFMLRQVQQPVKPVVFVVLDTRKQGEKKAAKAPSETSSFGGYRHFGFKRTGEALSNDLMGKARLVLKIDETRNEKKDAPKDTPVKEQTKRPANIENEKHRFDYGPEVQPGGFRIDEVLSSGPMGRTKPAPRIETKPEKKETSKDTTPPQPTKKQDKLEDDNNGNRGINPNKIPMNEFFRIPQGVYC